MEPDDVRIPFNANPQLGYDYGAADPFSDSEQSHLDHGTVRSLREAVGSLASSYSRAAGLYFAENLEVPQSFSSPPTIHGEDPTRDEQWTSSPAMRPLQRPISDEFGLKPVLSSTGTGIYFPSLSRHTTVASMISHQFRTQTIGSAVGVPPPPRSTFVQSVFNAVNVLVGIGILALPLAFRCAGWALGTFVFLFCALGTNYTAKILARCLDASYAGAATYGDMGAATFGEKGRAFVSSIFCVELMTIGVALVVLFGDGMETLFGLEFLTTRLLAVVVLTPLLFLPIRRLAYASLIGIVGSICLVVIVLYDGFSKPSRPGSLWDPMPTELFPSDWSKFPLCFGLMMAGFSGHAVFPSIYRDMEDPKQYDLVVDIAYVITVSIYVIMAVLGYLMFGLETMQEITQNLAGTPGYSDWINQAAVWLIVLTPLAKYGLMLNPVNLTWELWLASLPSVETWCKFHPWRKSFYTYLGRVIVSLMVIYVATVFPGFDHVMSLLGALFSFGISTIFPLACYRRLYGSAIGTGESILCWFIMLTSAAMAILGTIWSFLPM